MRKTLLLAAFTFVVGVALAHNVPLGYSNGHVSETSPYSVSGKNAVSAAVYIRPEVYEKYANCDITGVRVGLASAKYCDTLTVWVRETLQGPNLVSKRIRARYDDQEIEKGWNDLLFDTPLPLQGKSFYIGFTYSQLYKDAAVSMVGEPLPATSFLQRARDAEWEDISADGVVSLELLVGGENLPSYDLKVNEATATQTAEGVLAVAVGITNNGKHDVAEYDLDFASEGYHYLHTVATPIASGMSTEVAIVLYDVPAGVGMASPLKVTISRLAGGDDGIPEDNSAMAAMRLPRNPVVEEYTGTGCGWCPRGLVGMDKLHERYGDRFVGIAIHRYNKTDPMYPNAYEELGFTGAPSCIIDRQEFVDPYYGSNEDICIDFEKEMEKGAFVAITASAAYNDDRTMVDVTAEVSTQIDLSGAALAVVLTADSLTGETSAWRQSNYYSSNYKAAQLPDDLSQFGSGGERGENSFEWIYNDVAIASYYDGERFDIRLPRLKQFETTQLQTSIAMPDKDVLLQAIRYDLVNVNVFVVDAYGSIANAVKARVVDPTGVKELDRRHDANPREVARYTLDGRMTTHPQKGVNIVRLSDGSTVKILVR